MDERFEELRTRLGEVSDLRSASALLDWDQMVMMPPTGAPVRAERLATLERVAHERFVDDRIGELVDELRELEASLPYDSDDASLIRVTRRDWEKARRVPADLAADLTKAASEGMEAWVVARAENDYAAFRPWLDRQLALKHEYIACFEPADDPYDILLDDFEPGTTTAEVRIVFDRLRDGLGPLIAAAADDAGGGLGSGPFPEDGQRALALAVMTAFGFDPAVVPARHHGAPLLLRRSRRPTSGSPRGTTRAISSRCSAACTRSAMASTSAASAPRSSVRRSPPAARRGCTRARADCGRTSSAARCPSAAGFTPSSWRPSRMHSPG